MVRIITFNNDDDAIVLSMNGRSRFGKKKVPLSGSYIIPFAAPVIIFLIGLPGGAIIGPSVGSGGSGNGNIHIEIEPMNDPGVNITVRVWIHDVDHYTTPILRISNFSGAPVGGINKTYVTSLYPGTVCCTDERTACISYSWNQTYENWSVVPPGNYLAECNFSDIEDTEYFVISDPDCGEAIDISTDKEEYYPGETVWIDFTYLSEIWTYSGYPQIYVISEKGELKIGWAVPGIIMWWGRGSVLCLELDTICPDGHYQMLPGNYQVNCSMKEHFDHATFVLKEEPGNDKNDSDNKTSYEGTYVNDTVGEEHQLESTPINDSQDDGSMQGYDPAGNGGGASNDEMMKDNSTVPGDQYDERNCSTPTQGYDPAENCVEVSNDERTKDNRTVPENEYNEKNCSGELEGNSTASDHPEKVENNILSPPSEASNNAEGEDDEDESNGILAFSLLSVMALLLLIISATGFRVMGKVNSSRT